MLTILENKKQLMSIICSNIVRDESFHSQNTVRHRLITTGNENTPTEIHMGAVLQIEDMKTSHEAADIIIQQATMCAQEKIWGQQSS